MAKPIGTLGNVDGLTVGGRTFFDIDNLVIGRASCGSTPRRASFKPDNTSTGITVTSGNTFTVRAIRYQPTSTSFSQFLLGFAENDLDDSGTAWTNPTYERGSTTGTRWSSDSRNIILEDATNFVVTTGGTTVYVGMEVLSGSMNCDAFGYHS